MEVESILRSQGIDYEDLGNRFMVVCPFHDDNDPSAGIWADSGYLRCFGCGAEVSLAEFLVESVGITFSQARRLVRGQDDVSELEERIRERLHSDDNRLKYFNIKSFRKVYPKLVESSPEWDYVISRGINKEMIHRFDMRSGVKKYKGRVVLPIYTPEGRLLSYVGRVITSEQAPKTRKSRSPHRTLFGLRELVRNYPNQRLFIIVVVEGEFDAIYLQQFGIAAVSNMGTMLMTPEKIRLLRKYASKVILSYDGDTAGETGMYGNEKTGKKKKLGQFELLNPHVPTVTLELPDGVDPNKLTPDQVEEIYGRYRI
jgi:DNA primase